MLIEFDVIQCKTLNSINWQIRNIENILCFGLRLIHCLTNVLFHWFLQCNKKLNRHSMKSTLFRCKISQSQSKHRFKLLSANHTQRLRYCCTIYWIFLFFYMFIKFLFMYRIKFWTCWWLSVKILFITGLEKAINWQLNVLVSYLKNVQFWGLK